MDPSSSLLIKRKWDSDSDDELEQPNSKRFKNDVSLNYSSKDIGKSFISHLLRSLKHSDFAISDYSNLRVGHDTHLEVFKGIDESEIFLVVLSPNYASFKECLDELVHIMDCVARNPDQRKVLPVFYNVEPSDVRSQSGPFKESFEAHETNIDPERLQKWKQALKDVGQLSGLPLKNYRDEAELVLEIVYQLGKMLTPRNMHVTDHPVGIRSRSEELILKLRLDCEDVLVVGVFGFSGMGKTAIAKDTHNKIASNFEASCFLEDIHRRCDGKGDWKFELQENLISQLNKDDKVKLRVDGVVKIQNLIRRKKTLLILDDVQNFEQLEGLGINPIFFHKGSRIIVTTRNQESLGGIPHTSYHTRLLNERESRKLFIQHMFARDEPVHTEFVEEVVARAGGLPLVLNVWGRHFTQFKEHLPAALKKLNQTPHVDVQKQLQMSYDSLSPEDKNLFLDIACFFDGMGTDLVVKVLNDEGFVVEYEIEKLAHKFLVENKGYVVSLPYVIKKMGHEVVRQEHPGDPGQRTRLMDQRDVVRVLREISGTNSVRSIQLDYREMEEKATVQFEALKKMSSLRFIRFDNSKLKWSCSSNDDMSACFSFKHLKYLEWTWFPYKSLDNIDMGNVVVIILKYSSKLEKLWDGVKSLKKLKIMDLRDATSLIKIENFIGLENLEQLDLHGCSNLEELDSSIGCLQKLIKLNLRYCDRLKRLPWEAMGKLTSLQDLYLCNIPEISHEIGSLISLKRLDIGNLNFSQLTKSGLSGCTNLKSIPDLPLNIEYVEANGCINLVNLPSNISELQFLTALELVCCSKLGSEGFTQVTGLRNLSELKMIDCNVSQVSSRIKNLVSLVFLDLSHNTFSSLPESFSNLLKLEQLLIQNCSQLQLLPPLPSQLTYIDAIECSSLDVMPFDSMQNAYTFHSKMFKESLTSTEGLHIRLSGEDLHQWCTYRNSGNVLSFVAPIQFDSKICGLILCATTDEHKEYDDEREWVCPVIYNKTKGTSHRFCDSGDPNISMMVMFYPLNDTTLVVEAGDIVEVKFHDEDSGGLHLVYEDDVVDSGLVLKDVRKPTLSLLPLSSEIMTCNDDDDDDDIVMSGELHRLVFKDVREPVFPTSEMSAGIIQLSGDDDVHVNVDGIIIQDVTNPTLPVFPSPESDSKIMSSITTPLNDMEVCSSIQDVEYPCYDYFNVVSEFQMYWEGNW